MNRYQLLTIVSLYWLTGTGATSAALTAEGAPYAELWRQQMTVARTTPIEPVALEPDRFTPYSYSPALAVGDLLLVSGQSSIDEHGEVVRPHDFETQGRQVFTNLARVLEAEARVSGMS